MDPPVSMALAENGSRRARKKERTRREIYEAATTLFASRGFDAVTIEEICETADVAKATFFLHFPTKACLLFEYGRVITAEVAERLVEPRASAASEFRLVARALCERWLTQEEIMRGLLRELLADPGALRRTRPEGRDLAELVAEIVARGQTRGEFRRDMAPRVAAAVFLSSSLAFLAAPGRPGERRARALEKVRDQLLDLVLGGLVEPERRSPR